MPSFHDGNIVDSRNHPQQNESNSRQNRSNKGPKVTNWCLSIQNPTPQLDQLLHDLVPTNALYVLWCSEHRGPRPPLLPPRIQQKNGEIATWTPHYHVYVQMNKQVERTYFKKLLKCEPHCEPSNGDLEANRKYICKGDVLTIKQYPTLPPELDEMVINPPIFFENGTPRQPSTLISIAASAREARKKTDLEEKLGQYDNARQFVLEDPQIYGRYRNTIIDYYAAVLRMKPCNKPYIEYHFGQTRSGKTMAGYLLTGGKNNPNCHCQIGPFDWLTNYQGQSIMFLNEFRASNKEAFCMLLSVMEGFPADIRTKGSFCPVRIDKLIITCPRPPKACTCEMFGLMYCFDGEFASKNKYSESHELEAWEDVDQVLERIVESGGRLVAHARRPNLNDEPGWRYTSCTILGAQQQQDPMDAMLDEIQMDE